MTLRRAAALPALLILLTALVGPWLAGSGTTTPVGGPFDPPGDGTPLGTDVLGRDALQRVLAGGRVLVLQAVAATALGSIVGLLLGVWAGSTHHRRLARVALRVVDAVAAVPALLLMLLLAAGMPGSDLAVAVAIAAVSIPFSVRVIRESTEKLAATGFAREALARGDSWASRVRYDIAPGLSPIAVSEAGIRFIAATQLAATAGFLGLGAGAPAANWGRMVRENSVGISMNPLPVLVPAALLVVLGVSVTLVLDRAATRHVGGLERVGRLS